MESKLLSVVVPAFNGARTAARCLRSVFAAARNAPDVPVEIIAVDDASTDGTVDELRKFPLDGITERAENSGGGGVPRNDGVAAATGEYVWFVDCDDTVTPDSIARIAAVARSSRPDVIPVPFRRDYGGGPEGPVKGGWEKTTEDFARGAVAPWACAFRRSLYVPMPGAMTAEDLVWHFAQADVFSSLASVDPAQGPCYIYNRASPTSVNDSFRWLSAHSPTRLDDPDLPRRLKDAGRRWRAPADYLRSLAALYELGDALKNPAVKRWWWSRARKVFAKFHAGDWTY